MCRSVKWKSLYIAHWRLIVYSTTQTNPTDSSFRNYFLLEENVMILLKSYSTKYIFNANYLTYYTYLFHYSAVYFLHSNE